MQRSFERYKIEYRNKTFVITCLFSQIRKSEIWPKNQLQKCTLIYKWHLIFSFKIIYCILAVIWRKLLYGRKLSTQVKLKYTQIHILYLWENIEILCSFVQETRGEGLLQAHVTMVLIIKASTWDVKCC